MATLESLPDHLILDVVDHLDTARDVSRLGQTSRHNHSLMHHHGWQGFARKRFPAFELPETDSWSSIVDRLTYLDRCWDKRAFIFRSFWHGTHGRSWRSLEGGQLIGFQVFVASGPSDLLVCGAGEDLHFRSRRDGDWATLVGKDCGFSPGVGDVTALSVIERASRPEVIVGRADGSVRLLTADQDGDLGRTICGLVLDEAGDETVHRSPGRLAVMRTEWEPQNGLVISCRDSRLTLHHLGELDEDGADDTLELMPKASMDFAATMHPRGDRPFVYCAKFIRNDTMVCGISGQPCLQLVQMRPSGLHWSPLCSSTSDEEKPQTVRALEKAGSESVLLSAWDCGSYSLVDLRARTSRFTGVYTDSCQPFSAASSLLVYGTQRFVAGDKNEPVVRFFDFRYPKPYQHSTAMPCHDSPPLPLRPGAGPEFGPWHEPEKSRCDAGEGTVCVWHHRASRPEWRPDANVRLVIGRDNGVTSLAKASDLSDAFYCGLRSAFVQVDLDDNEQHPTDVGQDHHPPGWSSGSGQSNSMFETGISRFDEKGYWREARSAPAEMHLYGHGSTSWKNEAGWRLNGRWKRIPRSR
ncbi:F-box domain-containing protein [Ophiocordyceps camponoti-floridani]|uniref:F-box domain-containing protein n=1 Tax=Ophiocordyceps camponoti-floridani TaxID=2030778 RepID=A0A8H4VH04_9HYPO|nr:F-box domain-containing protein [Ophiocordyceps camponoti-floridani]